MCMASAEQKNNGDDWYCSKIKFAWSNQESKYGKVVQKKTHTVLEYQGKTFARLKICKL